MTSLRVSAACVIIALLGVSLLAAAQEEAVALPTPVVAFKVNPNISRKEQYFPTCHPHVQDTFTAFWCYYDLAFSLNYAGLTSPSSPTTRYPLLELRGDEAYLDLTPQPISETSALFGSNAAASSSWAAASTNALLGPENRFNSTSTPAVDPVAHMVFIPYGVHDGSDVLSAIDLTEVNHPKATTNSSWRHAASDNGLSLLHDVIAYEGFVFLMHNNTFYKLNATTMSSNDGGFVVKDPCNVGLRARNGMNLQMVTYGSDTHGPLNAFIVYGNTTNETRAEFVMCRVSHLTGQQKWNRTIADDFDVADITGGAGTLLLLTGYAASTKPLKIVTLVTSVLTGKTYGSVLRKDLDEEAFPVFVPSGVVTLNSTTMTCGPAFILQVGGMATAYCVAPFVVYNQPITPTWTATGYSCAHRPAYDPLTGYVVCLSPGNYVVSLMASTGKPVWLDTLNMYMTRPQIINDGTASYVFLSDLDSTLWGFKMALPPPPPTPIPPLTHAPVTPAPVTPAPVTPAPVTPAPVTPAPVTPAPVTPAPSTPTPTGNTGGGNGGSSGLTGGEAAGVTIGVILAVGIAALIAIVYFRRAKRRQGYKAQQVAINEYGSV